MGTEFDVITGPTTGQFATVGNDFLGDYSSQTNFIAVKRDRDSTTTTLTAAPSPSTYGQSVTLTATITTGQGPVGNPKGTVTFTDGSATLGNGTVSTTAGVTTATLTTTLAAPLSVGTHSLTATYGGDSNFKPSGPSSPATGEVVNKAATTTTRGGECLADHLRSVGDLHGNRDRAHWSAATAERRGDLHRWLSDAGQRHAVHDGWRDDRDLLGGPAGGRGHIRSARATAGTVTT